MKNKKRIKKERKYWDKIAYNYDHTTIGKYWKVYDTLLLDKIYQEVNLGSRLLEVACGTGLISLKIADKAKKIYGVDIAPAMIEEARKKLKENNISNVEFSVGDAYSLEFDDNTFDIVICINALHNMRHPEKVLSEIKRVLKSDGKFITAIVGIGEKLKFKIIMTLSTIMGQLPVFHKLNLDEFADFVSKYGFDVIKKERIKHPEDMMALLYIVGKKKE